MIRVYCKVGRPEPYAGNPVTRQAKVLRLSRSSVCYQPKPVSAADLTLMRQIDELHLEHPFAGARMLRDMLALKGVTVGRKHVTTLMRRMGIEALYRKPNTSRRQRGALIHPYLLRDLKIERAKHGAPDIFNTDQGSQFTSEAFTSLLKQFGIRINMDGKGCWRDNVFVERLWRSIKYEEVYLHAYQSVSQVRAGLGKYIQFYNSKRPHSSLARRTPDQVYFEPLPLPEAA